MMLPDLIAQEPSGHTPDRPDRTDQRPALRPVECGPDAGPPTRAHEHLRHGLRVWVRTIFELLAGAACAFLILGVIVNLFAATP